MKQWEWYKKHEKVQWGFILIPLWLQPIHMWAMGEQVAHTNELINLQELQYHLTNWNIWLDIFWLAIDYAEWIAIIVATEKFIRWVRNRKKSV
ncbi:hypothetical protein LCGC14_1005850 [marine sediment metagenome]|uniref:Uncharacterized protein n=1 Tax=marine sediment metagenome TaxID=412755 RepID=A0A0F9QJZ6_9ZZZZ